MLNLKKYKMNSQKDSNTRVPEGQNDMPEQANAGNPEEHHVGQTLPGFSSFKLDIQPPNKEEFCSIMKMVVDKLTDLHVDVSACDIKLFPLPPEGEEKMAILSITTQGTNCSAESRSPRWDNAFLNAFDRCFQKLEDSAR